MAVARNSSVKKNHQISVAVNRRLLNTHRKSSNATYCTQAIYLNIISYEKLNEFKFETDWNNRGDELGTVCLQEGENELYRQDFNFPKCQ